MKGPAMVTNANWSGFGAMTDYDSIEERISRAVEAALERRGRTSRLVIRMPNREVFIPIDEIDWVEAERNNVRVHSGPRSFTIRDTLTNVERRLPPDRFVRTQRSVIVNADRVEEIRKAGRDYELILRGGARLSLMRAYHERLADVIAAM